MKTIKFIGVALIALLLSPGLMAQNQAKDQQLTVPLSDPGKPYKLNVDITTGSIKVVGYEGKDVVIDVSAGSTSHIPDKKATTFEAATEKFSLKNSGENKNGMKRISGGENIDISASEKNNSVTVHSDMPSKSVTLLIKVPQGATNVQLRTVNNGSIIVENLAGQLELSNTNGPIQATDVSGSVVANTINGSVKVVFKNIDPKAAMSFTSLNGSVDITFPATLKANLKARSDRGDVFSDFDVATDPSQPKAAVTAKNGTYRLTIEDWIYGKIAGGGPELMLKTMNGSIFIRKAK